MLNFLTQNIFFWFLNSTFKLMLGPMLTSNSVHLPYTHLLNYLHICPQVLLNHLLVLGEDYKHSIKKHLEYIPLMFIEVC